jgi:hypothetical protein
MGLATEMKNLSEDILTSFKQRIKENEELVVEVQKTLNGFRKDQEEMASVLRSNATSLKKGLAIDEINRLKESNILMTKITKDHKDMATALRVDLDENKKNRLNEFDALMNSINGDIKNINEEVSNIFKSTNDMLKMFENKHIEMSTELREDLSKKMAERVEYTRTLLNGFQKRLSEISKENMQMAQDLRKDLTNGESERLKDYKGIMNGIHLAIKGIRTEVKEIQEATLGTLGVFAQDRGEASAAWENMQNSMAQLRKTGLVKPVKEAIKKFEKEEKKPKIAAKKEKEIPVKSEPKSVVPITQEKAIIPAKKKRKLQLNPNLNQ